LRAARCLAAGRSSASPSTTGLEAPSPRSRVDGQRTPAFVGPPGPQGEVSRSSQPKFANFGLTLARWRSVLSLSISEANSTKEPKCQRERNYDYRPAGLEAKVSAYGWLNEEINPRGFIGRRPPSFSDFERHRPPGREKFNDHRYSLVVR